MVKNLFCRSTDRSLKESDKIILSNLLQKSISGMSLTKTLCINLITSLTVMTFQNNSLNDRNMPQLNYL